MSSFFGMFKGKKDYPYNYPNDLTIFTPEEIITIVNPDDVNPDISTKGFGRLGKYQYKALQGLIELQKIKDKSKHEELKAKKLKEMRDKPDYDEEERNRIIIQGMAQKATPVLASARNSSSSEEDDLIVDTINEMTAEELKKKDLENRLRALKDQPIIPDTTAESLLRKIKKNGGKRKGRTLSKKQRREKKTRKGRKHRKTIRRK